MYKGADTLPPMGRALRRAREAAGLSIEQAARGLGVDPTHVTRAETRGTEHIRWSTLRRMVTALGYPLEYFVPRAVILAAAARVEAEHPVTAAYAAALDEAERGADRVRPHRPTAEERADRAARAAEGHP